MSEQITLVGEFYHMAFVEDFLIPLGKPNIAIPPQNKSIRILKTKYIHISNIYEDLI